jgi:hypothetical protein
VISGARRGLPVSGPELARLLSGTDQPARLAAALIRVSVSQQDASEVTAAVPD